MTNTVIWAALLCFIVVLHGVQSAGRDQRGAAEGDAQPYRTRFHFQPLTNWMNDPNGPMYYKGVYHLFYQYNPYSAIWGNMTWGHSVSYDLVNWINLEFALLPTETYDLGGCFSGSVTFLQGNKPAILYTGVDSDNFQSQNIAFPKDPSDPFLREWYKSSHNPVMTANDYGDIDPSSFRDPTTAWQSTDGTWQVIVGGKIVGRGLAFLYQSKDFVSWTRSDKPFHSSRRTGMLECPDFFPVCVKGKNGAENYLAKEGTKFVLKASFLDDDHYVLGLYKDEANGFEVETYDFMEGNVDLRYDYGGKFYASKSFFDGGKERRILWGWVKEATTRADNVKKGWSGLQSIPRVLWLSRSGNQLMQWPIHEIETLRKEKVEIQEKELKSGSLVNIVGITASQIFPKKEVDKTSFGAFVDINPLQENITLRILIDHSIVESFGGGGKTCITNRVYPVLAVGKDAELHVFNKGKSSIKISELKAWSMKEAKVVPFTKRRKPPSKR